MTLNWNEIKDRALTFTREWAGTHSEEADAKPFLQAFFNIFGVGNRRFGNFEFRVKKLDNKDGYIDLLWAGVIMVEMKSRGKNLDKAYEQAREYTHGLKEHELPQCILVSDFERFRLYDLDNDTQIEFLFEDLIHNVQHFGFLMGFQKRTYHEQDVANVKAAELMGRLHDRLADIGYLGHPLEVYLVRVLFCLFSEDTSIFIKQQFQDYIFYRTNEDGSDLAARLQELFQVLNTPNERRFKNLDEDLAAFPYINGRLFEEVLPIASFDSKMRLALLDCCYFDWSKISPAIFGSMFQSVMNPQARRNLGAHYTSESNILKVIKPLFLDDLWAEFEKIKDNKNKLAEFHKKVATLKFLDPACGCGNFLVITYRELRLLEIEILRALNKGRQGVFDVRDIIWLDVDMMYGIEYEEFPARIAETAMWLTDHQMNIRISQEFGHYFTRLPLKKSAKIAHGNALQIDWQSLLNPLNTVNVYAEHANIIVGEPEMQYGKVNVFAKTIDYKTQSEVENENPNPIKFDYILGNPPFVGSKLMSPQQRNDLLRNFSDAQGSGVLDYVSTWYVKAAKYIQNTQTKAAFVSTNSITQGEQVGILWNVLFNEYKIKIHFAHRTFKWANEGKHNAAVYCVIIGFANFDTENKYIFEYEDIKGEAHALKAKNINPYLVDAKDILIDKRSNPICLVPKMNFGNMPLDGGNLLFTDQEKEEFLKKEPQAAKYIKPLISAYEFLNGEKRWCLWLVDAKPDELKKMPEVLKRIELVKKFRLASVAPSTQRFASMPALFRDRNQPETYILIPSTTSENRKYIPLGFFGKDQIANNSCHLVPDANLFHFGILTSAMHMAWVKYVCGRLESRFRYSKDIVYNNFPFPENPSAKHIKKIEEKAQAVLDARAMFPNSSLADMYDPVLTPPVLVKAHNALDKAVDLAYRPQVFVSEANRMEFLFDLYERYTAGFFAKEKKKRKK